MKTIWALIRQALFRFRKRRFFWKVFSKTFSWFYFRFFFNRDDVLKQIIIEISPDTFHQNNPSFFLTNIKKKADSFDISARIYIKDNNYILDFHKRE